MGKTSRVIADGLAPDPVEVGGRTVVAAQLASLDGVLTFDAAARRASVEAAMTFEVATDGFAAFDLRQSVRSLSLDGAALPLRALRRADLGGGEGAEMLVLGQPAEAGRRHRLELAYDLATPAVAEPRPIGWPDGGVDFDLWCSDLHPGRYLEQWLPAGLCQDEFPLTLDVAVVGADVPHRMVANGAVARRGPNRWHVAWPAHHTSLSSLLVVAPSAALRPASVAVGSRLVVELTAGPGVDARPAELAEGVANWLAGNAAVFGPYVHGGRFVAHTWDATRGMEYDGGTTGSVHSLEHEVFHSWFGRGVKPASASDGWIDEAFTTWCTSDHPEARRLAAAPLDLDGPPVLLAPPSPWSRFTPREAYRVGYLLFAGLAHLAAGGPDDVLAAMAAVYRAHRGGFLSTGQLEAELSEALSLDVAPWWNRYVRGRA